MDSGTPDTPPTLLQALAVGDAQLGGPVAASTAGADPTPASRRAERFVLLTVASTHCAVPETFVTELERVPAITPVPHAPAWLRGVTNLRGDIVSVVDMRTFLGLEATAPHTARMLVVRLLDEEFATGLIVDAVHRIVAIPSDEITAPASSLDGPLVEYLRGVCTIGENLIAVLDLDRLLRSREIRQFDDPAELDGPGATVALTERDAVGRPH